MPWTKAKDCSFALHLTVLLNCVILTHTSPFPSPIFFKKTQFQFGQILLDTMLFRPCSFHLLNTLRVSEVQYSKLETAEAPLEPMRMGRLHRLLAGRAPCSSPQYAGCLFSQHDAVDSHPACDPLWSPGSFQQTPQQCQLPPHPALPWLYHPAQEEHSLCSSLLTSIPAFSSFQILILSSSAPGVPSSSVLPANLVKPFLWSIIQALMKLLNGASKAEGRDCGMPGNVAGE